MSRVTASAMCFQRPENCFLRDMITDCRGKGYSKNRFICDCAGEPTHAITTLSSNSLLIQVVRHERLSTIVYPPGKIAFSISPTESNNRMPQIYSLRHKSGLKKKFVVLRVGRYTDILTQ